MKSDFEKRSAQASVAQERPGGVARRHLRRHGDVEQHAFSEEAAKGIAVGARQSRNALDEAGEPLPDVGSNLGIATGREGMELEAEQGLVRDELLVRVAHRLE